MLTATAETIAAIATPSGRGGIAVIRVSGPQCQHVSHQVLHQSLSPRVATYTNFYDIDGSVIDSGLAIYFVKPNSFTGEDVLELQGHGGPVISQYLLDRILACGVRLARPGEFSERAFLNDKIDLAQAESIADLINASSIQAARAAQYSLQGVFSNLIRQLVQDLIHLRMYVEATLDFPEEEIDFLTLQTIKQQLQNLIEQVQQVMAQAQQGALLQEGMTVVIAGKPNAGKSSLLNCLSGKDAAIVTDIPGTTRDILCEHIHLDGLPLHIIDTAGLRNSEDKVEQEGIRRAYAAIEKADHILWIADVTAELSNLPDFPPHVPITIVWNKIDLIKAHAQLIKNAEKTEISLSLKTQVGVDLLREHLKKMGGYLPGEGKFSARARHIQALTQALNLLKQGQVSHALELLAEDLRLAQLALNEITGEFSNDDLLGKIFSSFCIGK